jgi:hypothetical protein
MTGFVLRRKLFVLRFLFYFCVLPVNMYFPLPLDLYLGLGTSDSVKGNVYNEDFYP